LVTSWLEGDARDGTASGTGILVHLARSAGAGTVAAASAAAAATVGASATGSAGSGPPRCATARAAGWGIGQTARGEELVLPLGPNEVNAALAATQGLVYRHAPRSSAGTFGRPVISDT